MFAARLAAFAGNMISRMPESKKTRIVIARDGAARLAAADDWLASYASDAEILIISPSREAGDEFVRNAARKTGARFGLTRLTLNHLAARYAAPVLARAGLVPVSGFALTAVAARAVHLLLTERALSYFAPVAERPGFPTAVARTLEELRMNDAELASHTQACARRLGTRRSLRKSVARACRGKNRRPRRCLSGGHRRYSGIGARQPAHPGPAFTAARRSFDLITRSRAHRRARPSRACVFATAARADERTIAHLERATGCKAIEAEDSNQTSSLASLKRHLFEDSCAEPAKLDDSVKLTSSPGEARECVEIARFIQHEAAAGVPFDRIAVFLRSPAEYGSHLEEAFRRAAIPAYFARGTSRPDAAGRALLALLACKSEGLSARRFAEYVSLAQVPEPSDAAALRI